MQKGEPTSIGTDRQLFVDDYWIAEAKGVTRQLHRPLRREIAIPKDRAWETFCVSYMVTFKDGDRFRAWYRADPEYTSSGHRQCKTAYAESTDAIHWEKPNLGLISFEGSTDNNLVWDRPGTKMAPFLDGNPDVPEDERYKAIASAGGIYVLGSPDGLRWRLLKEERVLVGPPFDSHNVAFWDPWRKEYAVYARGVAGDGDFFGGVRWIRRATSPDFHNWSRSPLIAIDIGETPREHLYTNACIPYERAPHTYLMFPSRFVPERSPTPDWPDPGVNDIRFMSSRDGKHFDCSFREAFVRPGLDRNNWHERAVYMERGILQTSPTELSMYGNEDRHHIRRYTLRTDGFVSVNAGYSGGEFTTPPLVFAGSELEINYSTSAVGYVRVGFQDAAGCPLPGYELDKCPETFGDEIEGVVRWGEGQESIGALAGRPVRLRFVLKDCDLYAFRFR